MSARLLACRSSREPVADVPVGASADAIAAFNRAQADGIRAVLAREISMRDLHELLPPNPRTGRKRGFSSLCRLQTMIWQRPDIDIDALCARRPGPVPRVIACSSPLSGPTVLVEAEQPLAPPERPRRVRVGALPNYTEDTCRCSSDKPCARGSGCINAAAGRECTPDTCSLPPRVCNNRDLQGRTKVKVEPRAQGTMGMGLCLGQDVAGGMFLGEYVGRRINEKQLHALMKRHRRGDHYYFMKLGGGVFLDGSRRPGGNGEMRGANSLVGGNQMVLINHSCDPNCIAELVEVNGQPCVRVEMLRPGVKGEFLGLDYNFAAQFATERLSSGERAAWQVCSCNAAICRGTTVERTGRDCETDPCAVKGKRKRR